MGAPQVRHNSVLGCRLNWRADRGRLRSEQRNAAGVKESKEVLLLVTGLQQQATGAKLSFVLTLRDVVPLLYHFSFVPLTQHIRILLFPPYAFCPLFPFTSSPDSVYCTNIIPIRNILAHLKPTRQPRSTVRFMLVLLLAQRVCDSTTHGKGNAILTLREELSRQNISSLRLTRSCTLLPLSLSWASLSQKPSSALSRTFFHCLLSCPYLLAIPAAAGALVWWRKKKTKREMKNLPVLQPSSELVMVSTKVSNTIHQTLQTLQFCFLIDKALLRGRKKSGFLCQDAQNDVKCRENWWKNAR